MILWSSLEAKLGWIISMPKFLEQFSCIVQYKKDKENGVFEVPGDMFDYYFDFKIGGIWEFEGTPSQSYCEKVLAYCELGCQERAGTMKKIHENARRELRQNEYQSKRRKRMIF